MSARVGENVTLRNEESESAVHGPRQRLRNVDLGSLRGRYGVDVVWFRGRVGADVGRIRGPLAVELGIDAGSNRARVGVELMSMRDVDLRRIWGVDFGVCPG